MRNKQVWMGKRPFLRDTHKCPRSWLPWELCQEPPHPPQLTSLRTRLQVRPHPWPGPGSGLISSFESQFPQGQTEKTELFNVHSGSPRHQHVSGTRHLPGTPRLAEVVLADRQCSAIGAVVTVSLKAFSKRQGTVDPSDPQRAGILHSGPNCK